ncbi:hypothetical protein SAMN04487967_0147 [Natronorubrum sediminis]|uniref:Uncharacterized protein n=1 Tax=Natronorubrum sediminis TaxID=640943 RepID=A0A1H6FJG2_9EURY|nr:hypothetical protein SAMN04487967_0147 [Natronorubrum sediminis]
MTEASTVSSQESLVPVRLEGVRDGSHTREFGPGKNVCHGGLTDGKHHEVMSF